MGTGVVIDPTEGHMKVSMPPAAETAISETNSKKGQRCNTSSGDSTSNSATSPTICGKRKSDSVDNNNVDVNNTASSTTSCHDRQKDGNSTILPSSSCDNLIPIIPETVLQFERQKRKVQAAKRASTPLSQSQLQIIHSDEHLIVVNKPSGVLTVPGINSNPSMLTLLYEMYQNDLGVDMKREHMITHRLDMDTSGIVLFAKTKQCMSGMQAAFRDKTVTKYYEALVCGHIPEHIKGGSIDLALQRDHRFPPFMRVATPSSEIAAKEVVKDLQTAGFKKLVKKKPKPSQTLFEVMGREYIDGGRKRPLGLGSGSADKDLHNSKTENGKEGVNAEDESTRKYPVTRIKLTPITGRTHQLRVHCAAIGHPIVGDPTYGILCEASPNGGFDDQVMDQLMPKRASTQLQLDIDKWAKECGQCMCLHARELQIKHPFHQNAMTFEQAPNF